ncbi:hypothetical protein TNCV_3043611 [Trichonephila clavipes]|nr:hypothetical protein TNCV_3043611 [Trichonephila clavipes]
MYSNGTFSRTQAFDWYERFKAGKVSKTMTALDVRLAALLKTLKRFLLWTAMAGSDVVQSGRPIFDDFFQHLWPYIGNNTANIVFQMVKRLWLIRIDL